MFTHCFEPWYVIRNVYQWVGCLCRLDPRTFRFRRRSRVEACIALHTKIPCYFARRTSWGGRTPQRRTGLNPVKKEALNLSKRCRGALVGGGEGGGAMSGLWSCFLRWMLLETKEGKGRNNIYPARCHQLSVCLIVILQYSFVMTLLTARLRGLQRVDDDHGVPWS